jgi:hypothetical protein
MIWMIAFMYLYRLVIRDLVDPIISSELIGVYTELKVKSFLDRQAVVLGILTYITSLLFLAMYYSFANRNSTSNTTEESNKNKA